MEADKLRKILEAAKLYYMHDLSQQEIAERLGISRPTVSRFLQQAKEEGIVRITIADPLASGEKLASELERVYGLVKAIVVPDVQSAETEMKQSLGEATALYLHEIVKDGDIIGLTWGRTLYHVAQKLKHKHVDDVKIVQLKGGVSYSGINTYATEILYLFGKAYNTFPHLLPLPAIVERESAKQAIEADRHIQEILELGKQSNIAIFTVGVPSEDSQFLQMGYFTEEDLAVIYSRAVGDICSRFFDSMGNICHASLDNRTIGIDLKDLQNKERSILVAGGARKVNAIHGALQGKYANVLVTDEATARSLLVKN